jgi:hypothetical protein
MTNDQQAAGAKEPKVVQTGARDLAVDRLPLATGWDAGRRDVELTRPSTLCLTLEPRASDGPLTIVVILGLSAASIVGMVFMLLPGFERNAPWGLRVLCVVLAAVFVVFVLFALLAIGSGRRWLRFDGASGLFTVSRRPFWLFWRPLKLVSSRPLVDLVGVQVIDCGWQDYSLEVGEPGTPGSVVSGWSHGYQLNLILNDKSEPRINIARHSDGLWMQDASRQLADFLNVPFFDRQAPES